MNHDNNCVVAMEIKNQFRESMAISLIFRVVTRTGMPRLHT